MKTHVKVQTKLMQNSLLLGFSFEVCHHLSQCNLQLLEVHDEANRLKFSNEKNDANNRNNSRLGCHRDV